MNHSHRHAFILAVVVAITATVGFADDEAISNEQEPEIKKIESLLIAQDACWNRGDIDGFMETYWKSDQLTFSGGGETTRGWQATLDRYKTSYPRDRMGKLHFDQLETTLLSESVALVLGQWHLEFNGEKKDGNFSLVMKKFADDWKIVHDHSSTLETEKGWLSFEQAEQVGKNYFRADEVRCEKIKRYVRVRSGEKSFQFGESGEIFVDRKTAEILTTIPADFDPEKSDNG